MIDLTDSRIGQLDRSNRPSLPCELTSPTSEKYARQADFSERSFHALGRMEAGEIGHEEGRAGVFIVNKNSGPPFGQ
jgi:hypothetical protein